jgi:hypothetical protein
VIGTVVASDITGTEVCQLPTVNDTGSYNSLYKIVNYWESIKGCEFETNFERSQILPKSGNNTQYVELIQEKKTWCKNLTDGPFKLFSAILHIKVKSNGFRVGSFERT